jgi:hypothetical protein
MSRRTFQPLILTDKPPSDLLVRHERLSHDPDRSMRNGRPESISGTSIHQDARQRRDTGTSNTMEGPDPRSLSSPGFPQVTNYLSSTNNQTTGHATNNHDLSFATLLMAAEQARPQGHSTTLEQHSNLPDPIFASQDQFLTGSGIQSSIPTTSNNLNGIGGLNGFDFEDSLQDLANFMDHGALSSYHFSSLISAEQPLPFFSPESLNQTGGEAFPTTDASIQPRPTQPLDQQEDSSSFSRFGSRLPSLQPEESPSAPQNEQYPQKALSDLNTEDRQAVAVKLSEFSHAIPANFQLPSRLALSRYLAGYVNGFHEHLPFLHIPTISVHNCCIELILAMAAVGAQYCFEGQKGVEIFHVSQSIAMQRIRQRDARLANSHRTSESLSQYSGRARTSEILTTGETPRSGSISGCLGLPSQPDSDSGVQKEDLIQTAQALLLLMAMATWAKHREILREALAIQSVLATLVRDDGFKSPPMAEDISWPEWIRRETTKRTKFIVFCFFNLHTIVYNIPSLILASEVDLDLPCNASEFKAPTATKWKELRARSCPEVGFQVAIHRLFSRSGNDANTYNSSLGNYVLVHALLQHIFFVRQISRYRLDHGGELRADDVAAIEQALRNWQLAWKRNPESSLDPMNPNGPVTFNSTALLRLAYIRLNVDLGPGRALDTRDPVQIANAFRHSPSVKRTPKLVRAVLHSAHALSIPVKIGIHLVAQTQTFMWSIQHSLCTLECAFLLSKWLEALSLQNSGPVITHDEQKIATLVKTMLDETEFAMPHDVPIESPAAMKYLSAGGKPYTCYPLVMAVTDYNVTQFCEFGPRFSVEHKLGPLSML